MRNTGDMLQSFIKMSYLFAWRNGGKLHFDSYMNISVVLTKIWVGLLLTSWLVVLGLFFLSGMLWWRGCLPQQGWELFVTFCFRTAGRKPPVATGAHPPLPGVPVFQSVAFKNVSPASDLTLAHHDHRTGEYQAAFMILNPYRVTFMNDDCR